MRGLAAQLPTVLATRNSVHAGTSRQRWQRQPRGCSASRTQQPTLLCAAATLPHTGESVPVTKRRGDAVISGRPFPPGPLLLLSGSMCRHASELGRLPALFSFAGMLSRPAQQLGGLHPSCLPQAPSTAAGFWSSRRHVSARTPRSLRCTVAHSWFQWLGILRASSCC